jgi:integrase
VPKLLRSAIEKLAPGEKRYDVHDTLQPGLTLRVYPSGAKTFLIRYRPKGGGRAVNPRTITLGRHPTLTPEEARDIARVKLAAVAAGRDPATEGGPALTVGAVLDAYVASLEGRASYRTTASPVRVHLKPALGNLLVGELTPARVEALTASIRRKGSEVMAGRVVRLLRAALRHARADEAGIRGVRAPGSRQRSRVASPDELRRFLAACREALADGSVWPWSVHLFLLMLFTGARPSEIRTARWEDVDLARGLLVRQEHKTRAKTGRAREIALSRPALELLAAVPRVSGNPHVIPGRVPGRPLEDYDKAWRSVMRRAGIEGLVAYDLRRAIPSLGLGMGFSLRQLGEVLGHSHEGTTAGYAWLMAGDRARVVGEVGEELLRLTGSAPPATPPGGRDGT